MTFPKFRKNEDLINKSNFGFFSEFICLREKCVFSKIAFQAPSKSSFCSTHFQESGKIYFVIFGVRLDFLFLIFFFLRAYLLKKTQRPTGPRAQLSRPSRAPSPRARPHAAASPPPAESEEDSSSSSRGSPPLPPPLGSPPPTPPPPYEVSSSRSREGTLWARPLRVSPLNLLRKLAPLDLPMISKPALRRE